MADRLAVLGCGYVGLTLAAEACRAGFDVLGVEPERGRLAALQAGVRPTRDVDFGDEELAALMASGRLRFQAALEAPFDVAAICVPTPLRDGQPDLSYIEAAGREVARHLCPGALVVLESTTYPGTTEELLRPILEEGSGLRGGEDFYLAHSPERIDPGNRRWGLRNTPKVVGGLTEACTKAAVAFYSRFVERVVAVSSPRAAEMTKLLENSFRHVNIALANEMAIVSRSLGIDPWEVIEAAETKPFGFMAFRPGPGVGGHCLPVDPQYLAWKVRGTFGHQFRMLELAQDINARMPDYVVQRVTELLNEHGKAVRGARILVVGVAYKAGSGDTRESPALRVAARLARLGARISYHDPFVPTVHIDGTRHASVSLRPEVLREQDIAVILTDHPGVDYAGLVAAAPLVYDPRKAAGSLQAPHLFRS